MLKNEKERVRTKRYTYVKGKEEHIDTVNTTPPKLNVERRVLLYYNFNCQQNQ